MNEKTRIEKIILTEGMTSGQFAQEIGVQNSTLSHILNNRNNPSLDVIKKILNRFPIVHSDWLILGQGPMYRQESHSPTPSLFEFEDESDSLSTDSTDNITENTHVDYISTEKNSVQSTSEGPSSPISHIKGSTSQQQIHTQKSDDALSSKAAQPMNVQTAKPDLKSDNPQFDGKIATKIILYYSDSTFQEFESK